jgi:Tfp pilus assembly protein PilF
MPQPKVRLASCIALLVAWTAHAAPKDAAPSPTVKSGQPVYTGVADGSISPATSSLFEEAAKRMEKKDFAGALAIYKKAEQLEPNNSASRIGRAACAIGAGDVAGAKKLYEEALKLEPKSITAYIGLASVALLEGRFRDAAAAYDKALALDEQQGDAHWGAAIAWSRVGDQDKARRHATRALELAPQAPWATAATAYLRSLAGQKSP